MWDRTNVPTKDVFDLFLLEATFDNQTARSIHRPSCTHFGEHELNDMLWLSVHSFADIRDVSKDRFLVSFSHDLWGSNGVALCTGREEGGIRGVKLAIEPFEELSNSVNTTKSGIHSVLTSW